MATDWLAEASKIYEPQFDYLDQQAASGKQRTAQNQAELKAMYDALVKDIFASQSGIKSNFGTGIKDVGAAYNQGINAIGNTFDTTRNSEIDILKQLGIEQAAPNILNQNASAKTLLQGILQANGISEQNTLRGMLQSALAFNTEQGNISRAEGVNQRSLQSRGLADFLNQIAGRKADIQTQVGQTAQSMRSEYAKQQLASQQAALSQSNKDRDFQLRLAELAAKYGPQNQDQSKLDPGTQINNLAIKLYGNPQSAGNAVNALRDAWNDPTYTAGITNPMALYRATMERLIKNNPNATSEAGKISSLADLMYTLLNGKGSAY